MMWNASASHVVKDGCHTQAMEAQKAPPEDSTVYLPIATINHRY